MALLAAMDEAIKETETFKAGELADEKGKQTLKPNGYLFDPDEDDESDDDEGKTPTDESAGNTPPGALQHKDERDRDFHLDLDASDEDEVHKTKAEDKVAAREDDSKALLEESPAPEEEAGQDETSAQAAPAAGKGEESRALAEVVSEQAAAEVEVATPVEPAETEGSDARDGWVESGGDMGTGEQDHQREYDVADSVKNADDAGEAAAAANEIENVGVELVQAAGEEPEAEESHHVPVQTASEEDAAEELPARKKISDEPLPGIEKPPTSPSEKVALDRMLAQHDDFKFDRAAEALQREVEAFAEQDAAEVLFKSKKLPNVRGAYKAPKVAAVGLVAEAEGDDGDEFDSVFAAVAPTPEKLEVAGTGSTAASLRARAAEKEPLRVAVVGGARCGAGFVAQRLAGELCGSEGGGSAALVEARSLECADAELESPELLDNVIAAIRDCPEACVLVHYPRSAGEARLLKERLAAEVLPFASLIVLEAAAEVLVPRLQVMRDEKDGEDVLNADFDEDEAAAEVAARALTCDDIAREWSAGCTKVDAEGSTQQVWERVALIMNTYLPAPPPPPPPADQSPRDEDEDDASSSLAEPSPSTSPEKPRAVDGAACVTAGTGGKDLSKKDKLKDKYKEALVEEEKRKAEAAIMAANPAAKKGVQGMSAALGISEAVVEEDEDEDVDGEEGDKDEPEIVVGDEDEEEEAGAGRPRGEDDEKAKKAREQEEKDRKMFQQAEQAWERMEEKELVDMSEEYQQMQDKKIVSAQSGERQNTRIEAAECIITFEEAWTFFKRLNREAVRANIVEHAAPVGCFAALREKLLGRPELSSEALKGERELVFCCGQVGFGQGEYDGSSLIPNALHLKMLQTVYAHLMGPPYLGKPRYGSHWEAIGFQGSDPATDLRDLGMFSVLQMVYLVSPPQLRKVRQIFRFASEHEEVFGAAGRGFPFTLSCISLSRVCLEVLRAGSLVGLINKAESVMSVLNKLTLGMLCAFYALWREKSFSVTSGDFQQALEHTKARALKSPGAVIRAGEQPLWQPQMGAGSGMGGDGEFVDFSG